MAALATADGGSSCGKGLIMPIAAVPSYLGKDFKDASPGLRFGMFLPFWTDHSDQEKYVRDRARKGSTEAGSYRALLEQGVDTAIGQLADEKNFPKLWRKTSTFGSDAWKKIRTLTESDVQRMKALAQRQELLAQTCRDILRFDGVSIAPFTTGLGNEHPLENGFAFLNPYGLPYLPGSGIKGVLRQSARELSSGQWGDAQGWSRAQTYFLEAEKDQIALSSIDALFGLESSDGNTLHVRGALSFWDAVPQISGHELLVEIMTPHQSHYYQQKNDSKSGDIVSPHDSGQPNPITFFLKLIFHLEVSTHGTIPYRSLGAKAKPLKRMLQSRSRQIFPVIILSQVWSNTL